MLGKYELLQFDYRGKCKLAMEGNGTALLKLWALQNTNGKKLTIIRDDETKEIIYVAQGMGKDEFPKITSDIAEIEAMGLNIDLIK
jgi:hypothetical protein